MTPYRTSARPLPRPPSPWAQRAWLLAMCSLALELGVLLEAAGLLGEAVGLGVAVGALWHAIEERAV